VYQPAKDDFTDRKLAEFINGTTQHSKASLFFVREQQEGVYTYGRRRLFLKVSENDQVIVRVGGGYETIERFIESHCPFEVRKRQKAHFNNYLAMKQAKATAVTNENAAAMTHRSALQSSTKKVRGSLQASGSQSALQPLKP